MKKSLIRWIVAAVCLMCVTFSGCCCPVIPDMFSEVSSVSQTPPPGTYAVSSIGTMEGDTVFYSAVTDEILVLNEDGTGNFYYDGQTYEITLDGNALLVDGEECFCTYQTLETDEAILFLYWARDDTNTIALRPIQNP